MGDVYYPAKSALSEKKSKEATKAMRKQTEYEMFHKK
jgi:hypothetical protein